MAELTDEAKALIQESIRIVREDKSDKWWRGKVEEWSKNGKGEAEKVEGDKKVEEGGKLPVEAPPEGVQKVEPEVKKSAYWGILSDDD
jgi:hypothetical protein